MKKHPLVERIEGFAPKLVKLPNAIRIDIQKLLDDVVSHFEAIRKTRSQGGKAARGNSGRPATEPPAEAQAVIQDIADGKISAYAASIALKKQYTKSEHKFSPGTLLKWAKARK